MEFKAETLDIRTYFDKATSEIPHTRIYKFKILEGVDFQYKAGQFCQISLDDFPLRGNPNLLKWSSYSIASSPDQKGHLEFSIRLLDTPGFTNHLREACAVGTKVNIRGPFGVFTMIPDPKRLMFVCTGTGIAPLISHIWSLLNSGSQIPITLFFGFKNPDVYIFREELEQMAKEHANFKLEPTIT
ncbi:MAG: FAD-dependent oxidoreductase, partial [Candidatus Micrarchaeota archaeon]